MKHLLKALPPVHELQKSERFTLFMDQFGIDQLNLTAILSTVLNEIRQFILNNEWAGPEPGNELFLEEIFSRMEQSIHRQYSYTLKNVINATGTILHTNLGRARLSEQAVQHVMEVARRYSNLEYKLNEGERGSRHTHVEELIKKITGAEAAMVVNNNAAAVYIILRALANEKEVIVSRGQLVEIGGSFRISSIMEESGARLVEVGTTNKTHLYDYERALNEETRMILKVHTSNFKIMGFTESVDTVELAELSGKHEQVIFYEDLGSGVLYDFRKHGIGDEPVVSEVLKMGADLVSFSGDKLLGGPQAGIIAGKKELIDQLKKHQLARVLRVDKMTLAALEGTLMHYAKGKEELTNIPVVRDLLVSKEELKQRTEAFVKKLAEVSDSYRYSIIEGTSQVGGGTMPEVELPTYVAALTHKQFTAEKAAALLRMKSTPAIVVRIQKEEIQIDLRSVSEEEEELLVKALAELA
ncbi:L-seryl-tRNA(Sec) selenium transferase [Niallia endozanthoxylica]|uniref:L-seryl-tRNA(Sec) selenium transferase n=1 Tax=Niallia endozanthoxylica TaxID=2036016 RepID=A0A5J5HQ30_9BACI|nr:L-seryl-tRNA(Sec) selenium transferase [Niallia endozanthoxylica]KAA9023579.1 L-seryl-tRNA(Sec) selenium transferase [Niallia endozanthoxylica]